MSTGDKITGIMVLIVLYVLAGCMFGWATGVMGLLPSEPTGAEAAGIITFWPLFFIKFLAIGLWIVVSAGFILLIG
jgi:hypothetical protein